MSTLEIAGVTVTGAHGPVLGPTSLTVGMGERLLVAGGPGHGHAALALAAAGRMRTDAGTVLLDGSGDRRTLARAVALVDVPGVSEPIASVPLHAVVGEELAVARRPSGRAAAAAWLDQHGLSPWERSRFEHVPPAARTMLLAELTALRPGVRFLVLVLPDRHGAPPATWWEQAGRLTGRGLGVVAQCAPAAAALLGVPAVLAPTGAAEAATADGSSHPAEETR